MGFLRTKAVAMAEGFSRGSEVGHDGWYVPHGWVDSLAQAGIGMTPELAMRLSYVYSCVDISSGDFGTMPCQTYRETGDGGRERVKFSDPGIGHLAYRLRWQPNRFQSAKAFWSTMIWQYSLRPACYAEIRYRPGSDSIVDELLPRHPDRVEEIVLPSGNLAYILKEPKGGPRTVLAENMFVVRNTSTTGLNAISRIEYGAAALSTGLALQDFTRFYFKKGATPALLATYKGADMSDEEEADLHKSIMRYIGGVENAGGVLLVPEDIAVSNLGVDPKKAELLGLKDLSARDIARLWKMPPYKLAIGGTTTYASQVQSSQEYVTTHQMPMVREFQDAIYIHLIVGRDFYSKFNTRHLLQADEKTRMEAHEIAIRARVKRPSECRVEEDLPPDEALDRLSELDHRPGGDIGGRGGSQPAPKEQEARARSISVRQTLAMHDNALRVLRRERAAVEKLAKKHATAAEHQQWKDGLKAFYEDHARFVADTMRVPDDIARAYAAQHGSVLEAKGLGVMSETWEKLEAESLVELALEPESIDRLVAA